MADQKITALAAGTAVLTDIIPYVSDPGGSAVTKKETLTDLKALVKPANYVGATGAAIGTAGLVPPAGTAETGYQFQGDGTYANGAGFIIYEGLLAATAGSIVLGTIPQTYKHLELYVSARTLGTANDYLYLRINAATEAEYYWNSIAIWETTPVYAGGTADTKIITGVIPSAAASAAVFGMVKIEIANYSNTAKKPTGIFSMFAAGTAYAGRVYNGGFLYNVGTSVTSLTIYPYSGSALAIDTQYTLVGIK